MRLCVVLLLFGAAIATPITTRQDLLGRYQQHSLHRLKRFSFWPFGRKKDSTTTSTSTTTTTTESIITLQVVGTISTPTSEADAVREEESPREFWGNLNPFRGLSNIVKKGYEKMKNSTVGQAIRNSSVGRAFRSGRNATRRGLIVIGRTISSGAQSVGRAVRKIKRRLTGEEKYRYFVEQVRKGVDGGDKNTLAMLDKLGINVTIDGDGVAHTVVRNNTPTATEILLSEGFFPHNTSGESSGDGINETPFVTDESEGSGGRTARERWPIASTTSSPATTLSTTSTATTTSRTSTSVTISGIISLLNTTLRTLPETTTTKSSPSTITLHTTSWPIISPPTTTQLMTAPPKTGGRDTNIEQPLKECSQQWCDEIIATPSENTTGIINTGHDSESDETDTAETEEKVFNSTSISEGGSPMLTPTTEYTLQTWAPGSHEIVGSTAESRATDTVMTTTAKPSLSAVETTLHITSSNATVIHPTTITTEPSQAITTQPTLFQTLSPTQSQNLTTTLTKETNTAFTGRGTDSVTSLATTVIISAPAVPVPISPTADEILAMTPTEPNATSTAVVSSVTAAPAVPTSTAVVSSVTAVPTLTSSIYSTFKSTTPLIQTTPISSTTPTLTTSSTTTTTTTPSATTELATIRATNSLPITTTTTSSPPTTTAPTSILLITSPITNTVPISIMPTTSPTTIAVPRSIMPITSLSTTTVPTSILPLTSPTTTTEPTSILPITSPITITVPTSSKPTNPPLRSTLPPIPPSVTDALPGAEGEQDSPGGNDGDFPSPFGPPTDEAGFPSPFGGSGGNDEFPDVFNSKGVRDRLREIYEKGDFSHDDLRNAFNFDPNDYHYYYDYSN